MNKMTANDAKALLDRVAERIAAFDPGAISDRGRRTALWGIIDTIAVTLAGYPEDCTRIALETPGVADAAGPCLIFGSSKRTSALDATFINGIASHALDYDDFSAVFGGHQSVPLVTPLFALAEERGLSGKAVFDAYLLGIEAEMRFARCVHPHHYDKGWHPTATLGIFGTAAACARLIGLDREKTAYALAISASLASGLKANFGTMTKPLHVGQSARNGLLAVLLAERGFDANPAAMEHHQGFLTVFNGEGTFCADQLTADWDGGPWENESATLAIKQFPCCGSTHQCITATQRLMARETIPPETIAGIEILPHMRRLRHTNTPRPTTELEAKFSVQYTVARTLLDGTVKLKDFENAAWEEDAVQNLLSVTDARPHPELDGDQADQWAAEIIVKTKDGRTVSEKVQALVGRSGDNAMTEGELWEKLEDCAGRIMPSAQARRAFDGLLTLAAASDLSGVLPALEVGRG
ncbi:MAG: MmgE/PrpD family protein [Rhodospirillaceae bacterium]